MRKDNKSQAEIARYIGVSQATVSKELRRNANSEGRYSPGTARMFADPYSSWQKGTVENTNKLIRQYIPKTMDVSQLSFNKLLVFQFKINNRPRKLLFFNTPSFFFYNFAS